MRFSHGGEHLGLGGNGSGALEASGDYRVLRKISPRTRITPEDGSQKKTGLFVDVETTGLDPERHEIIELAMVPFAYSKDGRIFTIEEPFHGLQEPKEPISAEITAITGITQEMVAGQELDPAAVDAFVKDVDLIVAHNAAFDRRFLERYSPISEIKSWACSIAQIDWRAEGFEGTRLGYLVAGPAVGLPSRRRSLATGAARYLRMASRARSTMCAGAA